MEVVGVRLELPSNQPIVLLKEKSGSRYLPIWIGANEATAIATAMEGVQPARPLTHDLMRSVIDAVGALATKVVITEMRDAIFFADLTLDVSGQEVQVSSRPSDAIALAVRTGTPGDGVTGGDGRSGSSLRRGRPRRRGRQVSRIPRRRHSGRLPVPRQLVVDPRRQILYGLALTAVVVIVGTTGYLIIEGVTLLEAFYMVVITVSTVGFQEEFPLSGAGRIWTVALIVMGIGAALYTAAASIEYLVDLGETRRRRRMEKDVSKLRNHVILCGFGRVGRGTWASLRSRDLPVVVLDSDPDRVDAARSAGALVIQGDATHNDVLELAGIESAQALIACVEDDSDNLVIALSAKSLRPDLRVICRATELESERKLRLAGADAVVAPQAVGAERLAMMAIQPELAQIFDIVINGSPVEFRVEELDIAADCVLAGKTIADSGIRRDSGATILAVEGGPQAIVINPGPGVKLTPGERLVVVGTKEQVDRASALLKSTN